MRHIVTPNKTGTWFVWSHTLNIGGEESFWDRDWWTHSQSIQNLQTQCSSPHQSSSDFPVGHILLNQRPVSSVGRHSTKLHLKIHLNFIRLRVYWFVACETKMGSGKRTLSKVPAISGAPSSLFSFLKFWNFRVCNCDIEMSLIDAYIVHLYALLSDDYPIDVILTEIIGLWLIHEPSRNFFC